MISANMTAQLILGLCLACFYADAKSVIKRQTSGDEKVFPQSVEVFPEEYHDNEHSLFCSAESDEPIRYEWFADNELLVDETQRYLMLENPSAGRTYHCAVSNAHGSARSRDVRYAPPLTEFCDKNATKAPRDVSVARNGHVTLSCDRLTCDRQPRIDWVEVDGRGRTIDDVIGTENTIISADGSLHLFNIVENRSYRCKAYDYTKNSQKVLGKVHNIQIDESMQVEPLPEEGIEEIFTTLRGTNISLECIYPKSVQWRKNGEPISDEHVLKLPKIGHDDPSVETLEYTCVSVENGDPLKTVQIVIKDKPTLGKDLKYKLNTASDGNAEFAYDVKGSDLVVQWFYNNILLDMSKRVSTRGHYNLAFYRVPRRIQLDLGGTPYPRRELPR